MIIAFWESSKGTLDSIQKAEKAGKQVIVVNYNKETYKSDLPFDID